MIRQASLSTTNADVPAPGALRPLPCQLLSPHFSHWMSGLGKTSVEGESRAVFWSDEKDDGRFGLCAAVRGCLRDVVRRLWGSSDALIRAGHSGECKLKMADGRCWRLSSAGSTRPAGRCLARDNRMPSKPRPSGLKPESAPRSSAA